MHVQSGRSWFCWESGDQDVIHTAWSTWGQVQFILPCSAGLSEQELKRRASLWTFASLKQPWNVEEKRLIERNRGAVNVGEPHWSPCISLVDFGVRPVWIRLKIYDRFTICLSVAERFSLLHPRWKAIFFSFLTLTAGVCSPPTLQLRPALCIDPSHCKQLF